MSATLLKDRIAKLRGSVGKATRQKRVAGVKVEYAIQCSAFTDKIKALESDLEEKFPTLISIQTSANRHFSHDGDSLFIADEVIHASITESDAKQITVKKPLKKGSKYSRTVSYPAQRIVAQLKCFDFLTIAGSFGKLTGVPSGFRTLVKGEIDGFDI